MSRCTSSKALKIMGRHMDDIKMALMLKDMQYKYPHRQRLVQKLKDNQALLEKHNSNVIEHLRSQILEATQRIRKIAELTKSKLDESMNFEYYIQQDLNEDELKDKLSDVKLTLENVIQGLCYRTDPNNYL